MFRSPVTTVVHPGDSLTRRQRLVYVIVLGALTALGEARMGDEARTVLRELAAAATQRTI